MTHLLTNHPIWRDDMELAQSHLWRLAKAHFETQFQRRLLHGALAPLLPPLSDGLLPQVWDCVDKQRKPEMNSTIRASGCCLQEAEGILLVRVAGEEGL